MKAFRIRLRCRVSAALLLAVCCGLLLIYVEAVKQEDFKTCGQSGFCRRQRAFRLSPMRPPAVTIQPDAVKMDQAAGVFSASLTLPPSPIKGGDTGPPTTLYIEILELGAVRVRVSPSTRGAAPHVHPALSTLPKANPSRVALEMHGGRNPGDLTIHAEGASGTNALAVNVSYNPLRVSIIHKDKVVAVLNDQDLLRYETGGNKQATDDAATTTAAASDAPKSPLHAIAIDGAFDEQFGGSTDPKAKGPRSFGFDILFPRATLAFGLAEHATPLNLPSTYGKNAIYTEPYRLYNLDVFEYKMDSPMALYGHVPLLQTQIADSGAVAAFLLTASELWVDIERDEAAGLRSHWMAESTPIDLVFFAADTAAQVHRQYLDFTGRPQLPSVSSIGYHQCRWNYNTRQDLEEVDAGFDKVEIPYDFIWLDIEHTNGKRYFTWDEAKFPRPHEITANLSAKFRSLVTINDPHIKIDPHYHVYKAGLESNAFVASPLDGTSSTSTPSEGSGGDHKPTPFRGYCWPGDSHWVDFISESGRAFWASLYRHSGYPGSAKNLYAWNDMNEPSVFNSPEITMPKNALHDGGKIEHREVHNIYGMMQHRATVEGQLARSRQGQSQSNSKTADDDEAAEKIPRPFVLSRAFFAGTQRYGAIWTGDNKAEWAHLRASMPMLLSLGVCGISFAGADVGGFFGDPDVELLVRWYEAGSMQPFFRGHAHIDTARREPWLFGATATAQIREAVRLRYRFLPTLYTAFAEATHAGETVMRPHFMEYPGDLAAAAIDNAFSVGSSGLLVAPVGEPGARSRTVYLPGPGSVVGGGGGGGNATGGNCFVEISGEGGWHEVRMALRKPEQRYAVHGAQRTVTVGAPLGRVPLFLRCGRIVPMRLRARRSALAMQRDPYSLLVVVGEGNGGSAVAHGRMYLDDETSMAYAKAKDKANANPSHCWIDFTYLNGRLEAERSCADLPDGVDGVPFERITVVQTQRTPKLVRGARSSAGAAVQAIGAVAGAPHAVALKLPGVTTADQKWWVHLDLVAGRDDGEL